MPESAIAAIPQEITAWELSSENNRTSYNCTLSFCVEAGVEDIVCGFGPTPAAAVDNACRIYLDHIIRTWPHLPLEYGRLKITGSPG